MRRGRPLGLRSRFDGELGRVSTASCDLAVSAKVVVSLPRAAELKQDFKRSAIRRPEPGEPEAYCSRCRCGEFTLNRKSVETIDVMALKAAFAFAIVIHFPL